MTWLFGITVKKASDTRHLARLFSSSPLTRLRGVTIRSVPSVSCATMPVRPTNDGCFALTTEHEKVRNESGGSSSAVGAHGTPTFNFTTMKVRFDKLALPYLHLMQGVRFRSEGNFARRCLFLLRGGSSCLPARGRAGCIWGCYGSLSFRRCAFAEL